MQWSCSGARGVGAAERASRCGILRRLLFRDLHRGRAEHPRRMSDPAGILENRGPTPAPPVPLRRALRGHPPRPVPADQSAEPEPVQSRAGADPGRAGAEQRPGRRDPRLPASDRSPRVPLARRTCHDGLYVPPPQGPQSRRAPLRAAEAGALALAAHPHRHEHALRARPALRRLRRQARDHRRPPPAGLRPLRCRGAVARLRRRRRRRLQRHLLHRLPHGPGPRRGRRRAPPARLGPHHGRRPGLPRGRLARVRAAPQGPLRGSQPRPPDPPLRHPRQPRLVRRPHRLHPPVHRGPHHRRLPHLPEALLLRALPPAPLVAVRSRRPVRHPPRPGPARVLPQRRQGHAPRRPGDPLRRAALLAVDRGRAALVRPHRPLHPRHRGRPRRPRPAHPHRRPAPLLPLRRGGRRAPPRRRGRRWRLPLAHPRPPRAGDGPGPLHPRTRRARARVPPDADLPLEGEVAVLRDRDLRAPAVAQQGLRGPHERRRPHCHRVHTGGNRPVRGGRGAAPGRGRRVRPPRPGPARHPPLRARRPPRRRPDRPRMGRRAAHQDHGRRELLDLPRLPAGGRPRRHLARRPLPRGREPPGRQRERALRGHVGDRPEVLPAHPRRQGRRHRLPDRPRPGRPPLGRRPRRRRGGLVDQTGRPARAAPHRARLPRLPPGPGQRLPAAPEPRAAPDVPGEHLVHRPLTAAGAPTGSP